MTFLLDINVLLAIAWGNHEQHEAASRWLRLTSSFATCPITQSGFLRLSSNPALGFSNGPADAFRSLDSMLANPRHVFWMDDLSFGESEIRRDQIGGHLQITDKYLAALARRRRSSLATFDQPLAHAFRDEPGLVTLIE